MADVEKIYEMIDWNMPQYVQSEGRLLAKKMSVVSPFIQPLTPKYNKNIWENCAIIISEKDDIFIKPYLIRLLEWLQDMNWPGAFCIFYRLREYKDIDSLRNAVDICLKKAQDEKDDIWMHNLYLVLHEK